MSVTIKTTIQGEAYEFTGANAAEVQALVAEMAATLDATLNSLTIVKQLATAKSVLGGTTAPTTTYQAPATPLQTYTAPAQQAAPAPQGPPGTVAPVCIHGPRQYVAKANWKAWFCPTPKGTPGQCDPEWIK